MLVCQELEEGVWLKFDTVLPLAITATGVAFGMAKGSVLPCIGIFMVCSAIGQWKGEPEVPASD